MYIKCCFSFLSSSIWAFSSAFTLSSFSDSWGTRDRVIRNEPTSSKGGGGGGQEVGQHLGHVRAHQAGNGLRRRAVGLLLPCPTKQGQQHEVWENPDPGEACKLRGFFRDAFEFTLKTEAGCDSDSNEAAIEPRAQRSPLHESNSPRAGLPDSQGTWGLGRNADS